MVSDITATWLEEKDRIITHCLKKTSKQKKNLHKKVLATTPGVQLQITKMYIKRCIFKYQSRLVTWQLNYKMKNEPDTEKMRYKEEIRRMINDQERLEIELFKDVTIPDMREKESKKKLAAMSDATGSEVNAPTGKKKAVLTLTTLKDIQNMFAYEADYEILDKAFYSRPP